MFLTPSAGVNVIVRAMEKAARPLLRDFGELENLQVARKGPADFVSAADIRTEKILREELRKARPGYGFLGEEGEEEPGDTDTRFIIDPIDGTTNFLHGIPHFCMSVGVEQGGELIAGVIHDPIKNEIFWAEKGFGAFCNERRLRVSGRRELKDSLLATGIPFAGHGDKDTFLRRMDTFIPQIAGVRRMGAAALDLAYVAAGRFEAYWEPFIKPWDIAAGIVLVREAGGMVCDGHGGQDMFTRREVLASNNILHGDFRRMLEESA